MSNQNGYSYYDVPYSRASASITAGTGSISTTGAYYHGFSIIAGTTQTTLRIYDATTASGNMVDVILLNANGHMRVDSPIPTAAKIGLYYALTGTGASGVVMFGPKG